MLSKMALKDQQLSTQRLSLQKFIMKSSVHILHQFILNHYRKFATEIENK